MGASSRSPSPMTTVPSKGSSFSAARIASTAAASAAFSSPRPMSLDAEIAAASVTLTISRTSTRSRTCDAAGPDRVIKHSCWLRLPISSALPLVEAAASAGWFRLVLRFGFRLGQLRGLGLNALHGFGHALHDFGKRAHHRPHDVGIDVHRHALAAERLAAIGRQEGIDVSELLFVETTRHRSCEAVAQPWLDDRSHLGEFFADDTLHDLHALFEIRIVLRHLLSKRHSIGRLG